MEDDSRDSLYDIYDSLSPYEVAVLAFTSPVAVPNAEGEGRSIVLTTKESYLWAGAVAHALVRNPDLSEDRIAQAVEQSVLDYFAGRHRYREVTLPRYRRYTNDNPTDAVEHFLRLLDVGDPDSAYLRTEAAVRSLVWRGYIEDPFSKKIGAIATAVLLVMPIGFTSKGPNELRIDALTWQYVEHTENQVAQRRIRVKVKEASEVVLNKILPAAVGAIDKLTGGADGQGMTTRDAQTRLAQLGYYSGAIDEKVGPKTIAAIRRFQADNYLDITGYLDPTTLQRLKAA